MSFSANLRELLDLREMQIKELSAKTGISKNTIDNYLSGQKSIPNAENAIKIAKALNATVEYLITGKDSAKDGPSTPCIRQAVPQKYKRIFMEIQKLDDADFVSLTALVESMLKRYKS